MALAWRDTVPDTVSGTVPYEPFARLLRDVMLTAPQEPTRKCIKIPTSSFAVQFRALLWSCIVWPTAPRDCLFQGQKEEARGSRPTTPARCLQQRLWPHPRGHNPKETLNPSNSSHICQGGLNGLQACCLIAIALHLGLLQGLLTHTAVTILHSSTMRQRPTLTLTAPIHPLLRVVRSGTAFTAQWRRSF